MKKMLCFVAVAVLVGSAFGENVRWTGAVSADWNDPNNWDSGTVPTCSAGDYAFVRYQSARPEGCTISSGDQDVYALYMSRYFGSTTDPDAILNCTGGSLTVCGWRLEIGYSNHPTAVINVYDNFTLNQNGSGGTFIGSSEIDGSGGDAVINMYGGIFNHNGGGLRIAESVGTGNLNLYGGLVNVNVWANNEANMTIGAGGKINVGDGVMRLYGDNVNLLNDFVTAGKIEAMPGRTLSITYNSEENYTYLQAEKAYDPTPADGETGVDPAETTSLGWYMANVSGITKHYLYMTTDAEPNWLGVTPVEVTDLTDPIEQSVTLEVGNTYHWRVDTSVYDSNSVDPNTIIGNVWSFEMIPAIPVINVQPNDTTGAINDTISFTVDASSVSPLTYAWYKSDDPDSSTPADDVSVGGNSDTLMVTITSSSDEAYYYCKLTNGSPTTVYTDAVELAINRLLAHYKFEQDVTDVVGSNNGTVIDIDGLPATVNYVSGVIDSYGIDLTDTGDNAKAVELSTTAYPNAGLASGLRQGTIAAWIKTASMTGTDHILSNWNDGSSTGFRLGIQDDSDVGFYLRQDDGRTLSFNGASTVPGFSLLDDQWHMVAACYQSKGTCKLYIDGIEVGSATADMDSDQLAGWQYPVRIGAGRNATDRTLFSAILEANVDDLRVYNYMLSDEEIAGLYLMGPADSVCIYSYSSDFDHNDDCKVDISDFAVFASEWLSCGLFPTSACGY